MRKRERERERDERNIVEERRGGGDDGMRGWASRSRATTVHNHVMRLSCQLRKYLSQFVACNRVSLSLSLSLSLSSTRALLHETATRSATYLANNLLSLFAILCESLFPLSFITFHDAHGILSSSHVCTRDEDNSTVPPKRISTQRPRHHSYDRQWDTTAILSCSYIRMHTGTWERIDRSTR